VSIVTRSIRVSGGRAVLLVALTFAFVIFGGALLIYPLFAEGTLQERFRHSREVFLLFSGMFTTIVGFYFASANMGTRMLVVETFDAAKQEMEVTVAGGTPPYTVELEYGEKDASKKKPAQALELAGTVGFQFEKSEWPRPIRIRVKDTTDAKVERSVTLDKEELLAAGFKEPARDPAREQPTLESKFDAKTSNLEVTVKGGKAPYELEVTYGPTSAKKPVVKNVKEAAPQKIPFDKKTDWPSPLSVSVKDAAGKTIALEVLKLAHEGFLNA
jgi:hypothetical protein